MIRIVLNYLKDLERVINFMTIESSNPQVQYVGLFNQVFFLMLLTRFHNFLLKGILYLLLYFFIFLFFLYSIMNIIFKDFTFYLVLSYRIVINFIFSSKLAKFSYNYNNLSIYSFAFSREPILSEDNEKFISSFSIIINYSSLSILVRVSRKMLNRRNDFTHTFLIPDLK